MKCFLKDADCREDCAIFQEEYRTCSFHILPVLLGIITKQIKELTETIEILGFELLQDRADRYPGEDSLHEGWEEKAQEK